MEENIKPVYGATDPRNYQNVHPEGSNPEYYDPLGGFIDLIGGLWNDWTGQTQQYNEYLQQGEMLQREQDFTRDMWQATNEFNDPAAYMERMRSAGINPNIAASAIAGGSSGLASNPSSPSAPSVNTAVGGVRSVADTLMNIIGTAAEAKQKSFQNALIKEETKGQQIENEFSPKTKQKILDKLDGEIDNLVSDNIIKGYQADILRSDAAYRELFNSQDLQLKIQEYRRADQEITNMMKQYDTMVQQINESISRQELMSSEVDLNREKSSLVQLQSVFQNKRNQIFVDCGLDPLTSPLDAYFLTASDGDRHQMLNGLERIGSASNYWRARLVKTERRESWRRPMIKSSSIRLPFGIGFSGQSILNPYNPLENTNVFDLYNGRRMRLR